MNNKTIFYHIALTDEVSSWIYVFLDQMRELTDSNLLQKTNKIFICAVGNKSNIQIISEYVQLFCNIYHKDIIFNYIEKPYDDDELLNINQSTKVIVEDFTLDIIWNYVKNLNENEHIMYMHSKGITGVKRLIENEEQKSYFSFLCVQNWRKFLEWGVIENYEKCCNALTTHDTAGVNWSFWPTPHYSGNFWWANSDYLKTLSDPKNGDWWINIRNTKYSSLTYLPDRLKDELWIGSNNPKFFSLYDHPMPPPHSNLGQTIIKRTEYCDEGKNNA